MNFNTTGIWQKNVEETDGSNGVNRNRKQGLFVMQKNTATSAPDLTRGKQTGRMHFKSSKENNVH